MNRTKIQNLQQLVKDIDRKIENLELQRKLYKNRISTLEEKLSQQEQDDVNE